MVAKHRIDSNKVAAALTSCGRFDLLEETVASFLERFDAQQIVVADDSEQAQEARTFAQRFPAIDMRVNAPKLGQMRSIDALYASLTTPYVLHLEDDWKFSASVDLDNVISFIESRPDISVVCIGYRFDARFGGSAQKVRHGGVDYLVWDLSAHPKWFSYSFNPSVGRLALWREIGPFARFATEENLSAFCKARGLRIAMVAPSIADHIGSDRHAPDPFQPARAKTLLSRLSRSVAKRLPNLSPGERFGCL